MTLDPEKFLPIIKGVARSVSSNFPAYVTREDTEQVLYVWLLEKRASVLRTVEDSPSNWESKIASTMRKVAFDHCASEKAATEGYSTEDLYRYSLPKIKTLMPDALVYEGWQSFGQYSDGQPSAKPQANRSGDRVVELIDIRAAVERLTPETQALLLLYSVGTYSPEQLAEHFGISSDAAKKRVQRAMRAVQKELGRRPLEESPGPADRRTVRSNAASRAAVSSQYDG